MKFKVWCPEYGGSFADAREFDAYDAEMAAEEWAEREDSDSAEYSIVGGEEKTVCVSPIESDRHETYIVSGESIPYYRARKP